MKFGTKRIIFILILLQMLIGCNENSDKEKPVKTTDNKGIAEKYGLTEFEYINGIGPIKNKLNFTKVDKEKVKLGKKIYHNKCTTCHKLDKRFAAPPLIDAVKTRTPEFIVNMIINPEEMVKRHPEMMKQFATYAKVMTNYNFTIDEGMNLLHFLQYETDRREK